jgi:glycosyltransferase involved in cell wall biosynthesis
MSPTESRRNVADLTVVVTNFNHQAYVEQCLDSIAAQTLPPRQVVVIDGCSQDDSVAVIRQWLAANKHPYVFIRHERNVGLCATMNQGLALAEGQFFCNVSADDWIEEDRFERQIAAFEHADARAALLVGDVREVDAGGATIVDHDFGKRLGHLVGARRQKALLHGLLTENVIPQPGVMMRTAMVRDVGGYDESLAFEDYDMWLRLATRYSIGYEPGIVANYRILTTSFSRGSHRRRAFLDSEAKMLAKHIGSSPENDAAIERRLVGIAGTALDFGIADVTRNVLKLAKRVHRSRWIRHASLIARGPGGLARLRRRYAEHLGVSKQKPSKDDQSRSRNSGDTIAEPSHPVLCGEGVTSADLRRTRSGVALEHDGVVESSGIGAPQNWALSARVPGARRCRT